MDSSNIQSTSIPYANWRAELTPPDRARYVRQLAQSLKHLSPGANDDSIFTAAKNFEYSIYTQSANKNQYLLAYSRKFYQIKYQIQLHSPMNVAPNSGAGTGADPNVVTTSTSISTQQTLSSPSPQVQMMHQQTQNMSNTLNTTTQQMLMEPQNTTQSVTSQPPFTQNYQSNQQQIQTQHQNHISPGMVTPQQQQQQAVALNQYDTLPVVSQTYNGHALMSPNHQQLQVFLARQRALLQQQQMNLTIPTQNTTQVNMNSNPSLIQSNSANHVVTPAQNINMSRQNQSNVPVPQVTPELAAQFKLQREQLLQQHQLQLSKCNQVNRLQLQQIHQRQILQLQVHQSRQLHQLQQQQHLTGPQPQQSGQTDAFTQGQPVLTSIQQQQHLGQVNAFAQNQPVMTNIQQQPFDAKPLLKQTQNPINDQQRNQATNMVRQLDENIRTTRVQAPALNDLSDQEKKSIWETVMQMRPMYEKINQMLPIFLALTFNFEATRRLIMMKYMFEDQLNALSRNIYLMPLQRLQQLREQFNGYFVWLRNAGNGNTVPIGQSQPQPQPQPPQKQQLNFQPPEQQSINHQTSPVSRAETSMNTTSSPIIHHSPASSPHNKRKNSNLNSPSSKKQRATTNQPTSTTYYQQQQGSNSTDIPATAHWAQLENASAAGIPDCALVPAKTDTPSSTVNSTSPSTNLTVDTLQQQSPGPSAVQNDTISHMAYQYAISSGIPSAIVAILPPRALKLIWLLKQESLNLLEMQKIQMRQLLDGYISQAKEQLGRKDHSNEQQQQNDTPKMDQQKSHTIDLTSPPISTNNLNWAMENSLSEQELTLGSSLSLQDLPQKLINEPISKTSAPSTTTTQTANTSAPTSAATDSPIVSTAILTVSPTSTNLQLGSMVLDDKLVNLVQPANDTLKDVSTPVAHTHPLTEVSSTPLFVMDDFILDGSSKTSAETQVKGEPRNNNTDKIDQAILFSSSTSSSESPASLFQAAFKEGYKDETFCVNELDSNHLPPSSFIKGSSLCLDQSSNASSLSSTSLSSNELSDDLAKNNNWYQIGMDKDSLGITDTIPGLDFDSDSFIGYDSGNRLSHPPLF